VGELTRHPREGWSSDGSPAPSRGLSRRELLRRAAGAGLLVGGLGPLLEACGSGAATAAGGGPVLPRPTSPVTWPIYSGNDAIAAGLKPEKGATLKLYNWVAYINQQVLDNFEKRYDCKVELTTFNTMTEAIGKLHSGEVDFDVFIPTIDVLGNLIESKLIRPLNHSYIPNIAQAWSDYQDPFYDQKWQYTAPYTIYTTGMAWRKDHVDENPYAMANGYAMPWQAKYKGKVAILDDYRESISLGLMKNNVYDLNTTVASQITQSKTSLLELSKLVDVHIDNNDYSNVPSGQIWIHHAWSGDIAGAPAYLPKGTPVEVLGYWFPTDGRGPVANDTMAVLAGGQNPVLAHLFLNYLLDLPNVLENISFNGYMQPLNEITPERLVAEKLLPPTLKSTAVLPSYFRKGVEELELPAATDQLWQQAWLQVSNGI
jgi:spermidine/putrescine transport system substrate-binding protein